MNKIAYLEKLDRLIFDNKRIILVGHLNPDGDSVGSLIGVTNFLEALNRDVTPIVPNMYPYFLKFLDPRGCIKIYDRNEDEVRSIINDADVIICMDFNGLKRIEALGHVIAKSKAIKVLIDHHPQPEPVFDLMYSYTSLSSTCEVAYWIIKGLSSNSKLNIEGANALYAGMMTDTNNFANSVQASTFQMAAELLELGVDKEWIQSNIFGGFSEHRMRLMGYILNENMKLFREYNSGLIILDSKTKEKFSFEEGDSEGFVNLPLSIEGINIAALFTEEKDFVKVSLRSKSDFSVNRFSRAYFNGGGHERAAGGRIYIPITEVEKYFYSSLKKFIEEEK